MLSLGLNKKIVAGKYLTFAMAEEEYAIEILKVREIIAMVEFTPIPQTLTFVKGVINLRGRIIPIIDLRCKLHLPEIAYTPRTCIVVVDMQAYLIGVIVDTVLEVITLRENNLEPPPVFGLELPRDFLLALGKYSKKVITLLDIETIISSEELVNIPDLLRQM